MPTDTIYYSLIGVSGLVAGIIIGYFVGKRKHHAKYRQAMENIQGQLIERTVCQEGATVCTLELE